MSDAPKDPGERESTPFSNQPGGWQPVAPPAYPADAPQQRFTPPTARAPHPPVPPQATPHGMEGYRPVYDGRSPGGAPPPNYPRPYYGNQVPYGQGYQQNYGQPPVAEMMAAAMLYPRWRRRRRHLFFWPIALLVLFVTLVMHGCAAIFNIF